MVAWDATEARTSIRREILRGCVLSGSAREGANLRCLADQLQAPLSTIGYTQRHRHTKIVPANSAIAFSTLVTLSDKAGAKEDMAGLVLGSGAWFLPTSSSGNHKLRMVHSVELEEEEVQAFLIAEYLRRLERPSERPRALWSGTVRSNDVTVHIIPSAASK
jgi:hypothetical protein